jgi:nicotinamide mononucleotide transporter
MTTLEIIATLFGLACVALTIRRNIWCWPTGLVQVFLYGWIFYRAKLYSDALLQVVYVALQVYGWYYWLRGGPRDQEPPIARLGRVGWPGWALAAAAGTGSIGFVMARFTDAALPYWDAAVVSLSLVAQFLLGRKVLENWVFWIVVDVLAIGVYAAKGLYVTTILYAVFLAMAASGWYAWNKSYRKQRIKADLRGTLSHRPPESAPAAASS